MHTAIRSLELVFGRGDDDHPYWLLAVRLNILLFLLSLAVVAWRHAVAAGVRRWPRRERALVVALAVLAGVLRLWVARPNLLDFGGIPYSRLLYGYKGHFATAQFFAPLYELTGRDIEHGIFFQRVAGTLTIPLVYALCRRLRADNRLFPLIAALVFAVYPLHIVFSASDVLAVFSTFLAALSYLLVASAAGVEDEREAWPRFLAGLCGLTLLTQVRYENVLLLLPAAAFLWLRGKTMVWQRTLGPLAISCAFAAVYACAAVAAGLSYRNPMDLERGLDLVMRHLLVNPFIAAPILFLGAAAIPVCRGVWWGAAAVLPWIAAVALCVATAEDGHGAARIYANWLILIIPAAGYGLALLLEARRAGVRAAGALALLSLVALPVAARGRLGQQYLEILEHHSFVALLAALPAGVERIIVPDDEEMRRRVHSTMELHRKYEAILAAAPAGRGRVELLRLSDVLDNPAAANCGGGACLFFRGLPCMDRRYWLTREQCARFMAARRMSPVSHTEVVAAPFVACSIYTGADRVRWCDPATRPRRFTVYRLGD